MHESVSGLFELAHALVAGTQLGQLNSQQSPYIRLGVLHGVFESLQDVCFGLLELIDIGRVVIADARTGVGVQLAHAPGQRAALRRLFMAGGDLDAQGLDDLRLGLGQIAEQVLQLDVLYFLGSMLVETLPVAGDLDELVELVHGLVHDTSCVVATDVAAREWVGARLQRVASAMPPARPLAPPTNQALGRAPLHRGMQHAGKPCQHRATCKTFHRLKHSPATQRRRDGARHAIIESLQRPNSPFDGSIHGPNDGQRRTHPPGG
ncbi:conserved hypothetical protein [Stutzerimonas stutzeri A1501]|uniref:Uncharacterized protein n=1 Tax=Stutzerimonas stutzeri (strain A1501) TaxID=379731 RepID=A4VRS4_STUS1|nr:conserved hypothetical protein [Stutzerimonas stutzeri A1501]